VSGNQQLVIPSRQTERMLQAHIVAGSVSVAEIEQVTADQRAHFPSGPRSIARMMFASASDTYRVFPSVANPMAAQIPPLSAAVNPGFASRAGKVRDLSQREIELPNLMWSAIAM